MKKAGIIGAMEEEVRILREQLQNRSDIELAGCEFSIGTIHDIEVILLKSGIGKVNAAVGTTLMNQLYKPDFIINTGSAGGFRESLNVGDVVISTEVRHHDVDATVFGYEYGQVPQMPAAYQADPLLVELAANSAGHLSGVQVVKGLIASGDSFMNDPTRVEFVRSKFPDLCAAEMEAAAIVQVCHHFNVPFVVIRSLSDIAGKESRVTYEKFLETAAVNSSQVVVNILQGLQVAV